MRSSRIDVSVATVILLACAPMAMACYKVMTDPTYVPALEAAPCTGVCFSYKHCPAGQVCDFGAFCGDAACSCTSGNAFGLEYTGGGPTAGSGCCLGGTPTGRIMGTCTIQVCGSSGTCCGWIIPIWPF